MCTVDEVWIAELTLIHQNIRLVRNSHSQELTDIENYRSVWHQTHFDITDKNNNVSFKDLYIHYITRSQLVLCCDTSDNVCLDLQNCRYSIFSVHNKFLKWPSSGTPKVKWLENQIILKFFQSQVIQRA